MSNTFETSDLDNLRQQILAAKILTVGVLPKWDFVETLVEEIAQLRKVTQWTPVGESLPKEHGISPKDWATYTATTKISKRLPRRYPSLKSHGRKR